MYLLKTFLPKVRFLNETIKFKSFISKVSLIFYAQNRNNNKLHCLNNNKNSSSLGIHSISKKPAFHKNILFSIEEQHKYLLIKNKLTSKKYISFYGILLCGIITIGYLIILKPKIVHLEALDEVAPETQLPKFHITERRDLPTYKRTDVQKHNTFEKRIWITYGIGVYDITDFVPSHPGGDKILLGAGSAIDPFWAIYQQHNTTEILTLIEQFRIGNLDADEHSESESESSIWSNEPKRHPLLKPASQKPFNAEPPIEILADNFYTPNDFFYVRNHLPVPVIDEESFELEIEIESDKSGTKKQLKTYKLSDIKALPKYTVTAAVMCGGNRRSEMTKVKSVKGLSWGAGAVGNAKWSGARLRDILLALDIKPNEELHVIFEGADLDPTSHPYGASIPLSKALDERGDVILAYEMNNKPLSRDHGYPLRVIVPGTVGARNVKWLTRIAIAENESPSHWQQNDYKGFSPSTDWDTVDFTKSPAIQAMPVTSAICLPRPNDRVSLTKDSHLEVKGYAWSGGGRRIVRVDLTVDQGHTWHVAELKQGKEPDGRHYGWSLWTAKIPISKELRGTNIEIWAKAVDSAYNVQPESFENIWNLRGVLSNAYHRVKITII